MKLMMTHKSQERIPKIFLMKVKIVRTLTKIWMVTWCQECQELEVATLTCQLKGVEHRYNNMLDLELLYLHRICRIVA